MTEESFTARPLSPQTWPDLVQLFGLPGGSIVRGCWCMYFRISGRVDGVSGRELGSWRQQAMHDLVERGVVPGLVGYLGESPAGWISLGPREDYAKLRRSQIMKPVDDTPCWSVVCSYVAKPYRGAGMQRQLLGAAIEHARTSGATVLEAYPVDRAGTVDDNSLFFGSRGLYEKAGFHEVARRSPTRVVMRLSL
jgi:GNAT superfamily N-acetyltransferase